MTGPLHGRGGGDFGYSRGLTVLVLDRFAIARLFAPGGQVFRWGATLGREIEAVAKAKLFPFHGYVTGDLQRSVGHSVVPVGMGVQVNVRAGSDHAVYYILGTRPHWQEPNPPRRAMRWVDIGPTLAGRAAPEGGGFFRWSRGHMHPGFSGRNFLDDAKSEVLLARGITV